MVLDTGRQVATYLGATFAILLVVIGVGACLLAPVLRRIAPPDRTAAAAATGFAVVVIAPSWWSYLERPMAPPT